MSLWKKKIIVKDSNMTIRYHWIWHSSIQSFPLQDTVTVDQSSGIATPSVSIETPTHSPAILSVSKEVPSHSVSSGSEFGNTHTAADQDKNPVKSVEDMLEK